MEKCVACQFYDRGNHPQADLRGAQWGQCRRSAPHLHPVNQKAFMIEGVWPHVRDDDWCGEWKAARRAESRPMSDFAATGPLTPQPQPQPTPRFGSDSAFGRSAATLPRTGSELPLGRPRTEGLPPAPATGSASAERPAASASVSQINVNAGGTPAAATALGSLRSTTGRGD